VCLIVDANVAAVFLAQPNPVTRWLLAERGKPRLVAAGKLREELAKHEGVRALLVQLERAGRLRPVDSSALRKKEIGLRSDGLCRSNDHHVLALAILSGARTLATLDNTLADDFKNLKIISQPRGSIYRDPEAHAHLLRHTPASCGVTADDRRIRRRRRGRI
jgi:predicted nucleic acid-binding protein